MATLAQSSTTPTQPLGLWDSFLKGIRSNGIPWLFILPSLIVMLIITFAPQAYQIIIAFTDFEARNLGGTPATYLGLDNFRRVLTNDINVVNYNFFPLLGFNIVWTVVNVALHAGIGLAVALALNAEHVIGRRLYRVIFVLPWALPGYITALIWNNLWQQNNGGVNLLFDSLNENLGTQLPTRTAWLTNLEPPIDLRGIVPLFIVISCSLLVYWLVRRSQRGALLEQAAPNAAPQWTLVDYVRLGGVALLTVAFFFLPWFTVSGTPLSAFDLLWNNRALGDTVNLQLLIWIFFPTLIAVAVMAMRVLNPTTRNYIGTLLALAGGVGLLYFLAERLSVSSLTDPAPAEIGYWLALIACVIFVAQTFLPRSKSTFPGGTRLSLSKTVFTATMVVLLALAAIGTLMDMLTNGGQSSNAVVQLFDRAGAPMLAFYAVLIANVWLGWPFMMVVATGALQSIPPDLYEAADVDGATKWTQFRKITLPLLRPAMVPAIMLGTVWTFNQFNVIFFITAGGPRGQTDLLVTQAYKLIQQEQIYGVAAAFSILVFFILLVITLIQNRITRATRAFDEA